MRFNHLIKKVSLACCAFLFATATFAETKIAVVDAEMAVINSNAWKSTEAKIKSSVASDDSKLKRLENEIMGMQKRVQTNGASMTNEQKLDLDHEFKKKQLEFQELLYKRESKVKAEHDKFMQTIAPKLQKVIDSLAAQRGLDLILMKQTVQYVKPSLDLTNEVTKRLNQ